MIDASDTPRPALPVRLGRRRVLLLATVIALLAAGGDLARGTFTPPALAPGIEPLSLGVPLRATAPQASAAAREAAAVERVRRRIPYVTRGGGQRREIALTFDDGPGPYTPEIVRALRRVHAPATFFGVGMMLRYFRAGLRDEVRAGFPVGDHTEDHAALSALTPRGQRREILGQAARMHRAGAPVPHLFRPPAGVFNHVTLRILGRAHMLMVLWTVDTQDYLRPGVKAIVRAAVDGAKPGAIVLLHDAGGDRSQTAAAIPFIVHRLRERGYRLVTVPRMLADDPPRGRPPLPGNLATG